MVVVGVDTCERVGGEVGSSLASSKVYICFIFCRIQLIISKITMIIRNFLFTSVTLKTRPHLFINVCCAKIIIVNVCRDINKFGKAL